MSVALLDVNVLVALHDPAHPNHEEAHAWFAAHRKRGWATCPITITGCVRVLSNPAYPSVETTPGEVISRLRVLCAASDHHFWEDSISLLDEALFRSAMIPGHRSITDICLLALAVTHHGKLVSFDRSIPLKPVVGAEPRHLELLGSPR
ncbi:MAG: PIN domain-containing protein [Acidobacteria bacterium]|nr:PIN domain-containing protein [Acidobacteriota bacterium]